MTLLVVFVLACASLTFGAEIHYVPPYVQYKNSINQAYKEVNNHMVIDVDGDITDPNRHYIVIVDSLSTVVNRLMDNRTAYDEIYIPSIDQATPDALENPLAVVNEMKVLLQNLNNRISPITTLIETTCSFDDDQDACSQVIDEKVKGDPEKYQFVADLLIAAGRLSNAYNDFQTSNFADAAAKYEELPLLVTSQDSIKPFVNLAFDVVELLDS